MVSCWTSVTVHGTGFPLRDLGPTRKPSFGVFTSEVNTPKDGSTYTRSKIGVLVRKHVRTANLKPSQGQVPPPTN